ncbi:iron-containing redox enzyme family protein [Patulibacter sp.]|uniref:iron-containing redox enzyme family protein n=1 Tax=Patulibacter sp. TaxID=1912859 RepID=UPI002716A77E|nr:iron-containing redox enzyme family protein [Patulibacter sp.]MDO9408540.1 iron-containing redox enzyme family protein [Patulibacter sp.]
MSTIGLPTARGPLTEGLLHALEGDPGSVASIAADVDVPAATLTDEDLQLALYLCYELHYRGLPGVDDAWEWDPALLAFRGRLERAFEAEVRRIAPRPDRVDPDRVDDALREIVHADDGPSLSGMVEKEAGLEQVRELLIHRSAYQLKEADPHSFALPRLWGRPKSAMVEIQVDEYGAGKPDRIHADLFAATMDELDLDPRYGAYLDVLPATTLATVNLASLFGLHRRLRAACAGHLALTEMTSSVPSRRYAAGLRRLGHDSTRATEFFDEHVEADAVHESIAAVDLAGGLAHQDVELGCDALFGAAALAAVEERFASAIVDAWASGRSSLRTAPVAAD